MTDILYYASASDATTEWRGGKNELGEWVIGPTPVFGFRTRELFRAFVSALPLAVDHSDMPRRELQAMLKTRPLIIAEEYLRLD